MDMFGQILTEVWDEFQKDPIHRYYIETSKETMKLIILDLDHHSYDSKVTIQEKIIDIHVGQSKPDCVSVSSVLSSLANIFWIQPAITYHFESKQISIHHSHKTSLTFMRKDDIPKGKVIIRKTKANDPFVD